MKSAAEVILYPSFWAISCHRAAHKLYTVKWFFVARLISQVSRFFTGIEIHPGAEIGKGVFIDHGMGVVIGETCQIGDNVLIFQGVTLGGTGKDVGKRHPTVRDNVVIGAGARILGPFTVGENSKIGAGAVVLREVPPYSTVVGVPGRIVRRSAQRVAEEDCMDQVRLPDPVSMELCGLRARIEVLERQVLERQVLEKQVLEKPALDKKPDKDRGNSEINADGKILEAVKQENVRNRACQRLADAVNEMEKGPDE